MAITTSYAWRSLEQFNSNNLITSNADVTALANGGFVIAGDHVDHTDFEIYTPDGQYAFTGETYSLARMPASPD